MSTNENVLRCEDAITHSDFYRLCHHLYFRGPVDFPCHVNMVKDWKDMVELSFQTWLSNNTVEWPFQKLEMHPYKEDTNARSRLRLEWNPQIDNNLEAKRFLESTY